MSNVAGAGLGVRDGLRAVPQACRLLWRIPRVVLWLLPPLLLTLVLNGLAFYFGFGWIQGQLAGWLGDSGWLRWVFDFLGAAVVVVALGWTFAWVFLTLAGPFQDFISVAVEREVDGVAGPDPAGWRGMLRGLAKSLVQAVWMAAGTAVFLVLALVPLAGSVMLMLWGMFALGYSFATIPAGRMAIRIRVRLAFARRHLRALIGLGGVAALASLVPLLNVLLMPVFVVAGTLVFLAAAKCDRAAAGGVEIPAVATLGESGVGVPEGHET